MTDKDDKIKQQRDSFLAFAFASADLFFEIDKTGNISNVIGAPNLLMGMDESELISRNWLSLFSDYDQKYLKQALEENPAGKRCGPVLIELGNDQKRKGIFTGIKMPGSEAIYITLGLSNKLMSKLAAAPPNRNKELSDKSDFLIESEKAFDFARSIGENADVTLFDFGITQTVIEEFNDEDWGAFQENLTEYLQSKSLNNTNPGQFENHRYALTHDQEIDEATLRRDIKKIIDKYVPDDIDIPVYTQTVHADLDSISEWEAEKALDYLVTGFEAQDDEQPPEIEHLKESIQKFGTNNHDKIKELQSIIERVDFTFAFLPVKCLEEDTNAHYEMIPKFRDGETKSWLHLIEDSGLSADFDLAYIERAINHISFKAGGSSSIFSANLCAMTIEQTDFAEKFIEHLNKGKNVGERLIVNLCNLKDVRNWPQIKILLNEIQQRKHKISVSGLSVTSQKFQSLTDFQINYISINYKDFYDIATNERTQSYIKAMATYANERKIKIIADGVKNQEQSETLKKLGITNAKGSYIGKPQNSPDFKPPAN